MSSILTRPEIDIFEQLMIVSTLRGREGSGIIAVDADVDKKNNFNPISTHKYIYSGAELLNLKGYKDKVFNRPKSTLIGHCRLPTKGNTSVENVHPHVVGQLAGVHNGTMWSVNSKYLTDTQSDSLALYKLISEKGIQEAVNNSSGAYALVWVDNQEETVNFLRNSDRPLWFGVHDWQADKPTTLFWASEKNFLELCMGRAGLKPKVWQLPADEVHTFSYIPEGILQPVITPCKKKYYSSWGHSEYGWVTDEVTGKQHWLKREAGATRETFRGRGRGVGDMGDGDTQGSSEGGLLGSRQSQVQEALREYRSNVVPLIQGPSNPRTDYERGHWAERRQELLSLPAPRHDNGGPVLDEGRADGTGQSRTRTSQTSQGMAEELTMSEEEKEFKNRLRTSLELLRKENPPVVFKDYRTHNQNWRHLHGGQSKSERKAEKRQKALARGGKGPHNQGHKTFKETIPGWFIPPVELVTILHVTKCEYCNQPGRLAEYTAKKLKWLARDRFMCADCTANPDAVADIKFLFPAAFATGVDQYKTEVYEGDPVDNLFRKKPVCVEAEDAQADCAMVNSEATNDNQGTVH